MFSNRLMQSLRQSGMPPEHLAVIENNLPVLVDSFVDTLKAEGWTLTEPVKVEEPTGAEDGKPKGGAE